MKIPSSPRDDSWYRRLLLTSSAATILMLTQGNAVWAQSVPQNAAAGAVVQVSTQTAAATTPQTAAAAATTEAAPEAITVTGTRIQAPGLVSANPIDTITSVEIAETGQQNLSDVLAQRPEFQNNQGPSNSAFFINGADINAANLRGLGPYRTLTLIDGVRQVGQLSGVNNSGGTSIVDLNTIAPLLIDSIDVVTGGESALYGADAVAGVLNFKLKKNFEGAEATAEYGTTTDGGGTTTSFDGIFGANFAQDRGNITFSIDYANTATISGFDRPSLVGAQTPAFTNFPDGAHSNLVCCASSGLVNISGAPVVASFNTPTGNVLIGNQTFNTAGNTLIPFNPGTPIPGFGGVLVFSGTGQGYSTENVTLTPSNTRNVDETILTYKLADDFGPFKTINFTNDFKFGSSHGVDNASPFTLSSPPGSLTGQIVVPLTSVFVPQALRTEGLAIGATSVDLSRPLNDWTSFQTEYDYELFRDVVGFNGEFKNGWEFNTYYNYGRNQDTFINTSGFASNLNNAVNAVVNPATGQVVCADSLINPNDGCIPINPFKVGALTQAQQRSIFFNSKEVDVFQESDFAANVNGDIIHYGTPFTHTDVPLSFASGIEWREESDTSILDTPSQQPVGTQGQNQTFGNTIANLPTAGIYTTKEIYTELRVPVLRDLPFAQAVDIDGAIRGQDYSTTGDDYTWDLNATWKVIDDLTIRGSAGKSVRAPNEDELFSGGAESFVGITDPCLSTTINLTPTRAANCIAHGVPAAGVNQVTAGPPATFITGNPNLTSETGRSLTGGFVFTPTFVPRFATTLDFYQIRINAPITEADVGGILTGCIDQSIQADCNAITRRADGSINLIATPYINGSGEIIRGADWTTSYRITDEQLTFLPPESKISLGTTLSWIPEHTLRFDAQDPTQETGLAGQFGFPRWSGSLRSEYTQGPVSLGYSVRFIGEQILSEQVTGLSESPSTIPTVFYHDLNASYQWKNLTFSTGVQNLFDQLPPPQTIAVQVLNQARPVEEPVSAYNDQGRFVYTSLKVAF